MLDHEASCETVASSNCIDDLILIDDTFIHGSHNIYGHILIISDHSRPFAAQFQQHFELRKFGNKFFSSFFDWIGEIDVGVYAKEFGLVWGDDVHMMEQLLRNGLITSSTIQDNSPSFLLGELGSDQIHTDWNLFL